jgi:chromosome partitioning protein
MKIVAVANQKGGTGKTTVAVHFADFLVRQGNAVVLADADPQGSASLWFGKGENFGYQSIKVEESFKRELGPYLDGIDYVVIDCPPNIDSPITKAAIKNSSLVLMPISASPLDLYASGGTIKLARSLGKNVCVVVNRFSKNKVVARAIVKAVEKMPVELIKYAIGARVAFEEAPATNSSVLSAPSSDAAFECNRAFKEVMKFIL